MGAFAFLWAQEIIFSLSPGPFMETKSTIEEIRARFDREVERFTNLDAGQSATIDSPLALELIKNGALWVNPNAKDLLDLGCGAGNYSLKLLEALPDLNVSLIDLSRNMLDRAVQRVVSNTKRKPVAIHGDVRELNLGQDQFDIIVAGMVLHHLREDSEWEAVYRKLCEALRPGGSLWVCDFVSHSIPEIQRMMWQRYGEYLTSLKDEAYRDHVLAYVTKEDSPRPLLYQTDLLKAVGFKRVEVLHKNNCFAVFCGVK